MQLIKIPQYINCKKIYQFSKKDLVFNHISTHSSHIKKSSIFVIQNNLKINHNFILEAIKKGAVGIITSKYLKNFKVNQYIVEDIDISLRILLYKLYPNKPPYTLAITGTNGKTSVAWYVSQINLLNKIPNKTYGTLGFYINNKKKRDTILTTPNIDVLHQNSFSKSNNKYNFIFEASSHSLKQNRLQKFPIDIAAITNISQDHLDYHKNIKKYQKVKFSLFENFLSKQGYAILNDNINNINQLKKTIKKNKKIITYGCKYSDINLSIFRKNTIVKFFKKKFILENIIFNNIDTENIACAIACCYCLNIRIEKIIKVINKITHPPGRLEKIINSKKYQIYVDYAHTPEALKQILINLTYNNIKPNLLFGCGGDRDKDKRSKMGYIANKFANNIYITDDNPRNENPALIRKNIIDHCKRGLEIPNRKKAIFYAIDNLKKKEILIIAGKGHEKFQIIKNKILKFDDVKMIKLALENR